MIAKANQSEKNKLSFGIMAQYQKTDYVVLAEASYADFSIPHEVINE
ncbi:hypothetical protein [Neisseria sp.]|nr:hypothetical protein [Neisseria sp.]